MSNKLVIDLSGPKGNAFSLMSQARQIIIHKNLDLDIDAILEEMQAKDYVNLLDVFETYFGEYVTLINR